VTKLTETVYQESAPRIDADSGVIYGVKILGEVSRNKRRYRPKGMKEAAAKYNGTKSYVDHPNRERLSEDRKFTDWAGVFQNARYEEGKGIFADLHLRKSNEHFAGILEAAEKFPTAVGFSHVAEGESKFEDDIEIVESIKEVFSVDLVTDPATTAGFWESYKQSADIREVVETLPADEPLRKRITEMMDYMAGGYGEKEALPTDALSQAMAVLKDTVAALADSLKALAKANKPAVVAPTPPGEEPPADEEEDEEMSDDDKAKIAAFENVQRENAELRASKLLLESGRQATPVRMKALANCATEEEQRELLESWPKVEETRRPSHSPGIVEAVDDFPRGNPEKFAALLR
jgi:hypothetical protein